MQQKDLRKLCGKLKEDRLLAVSVSSKSQRIYLTDILGLTLFRRHSRQETREGQLRPINKDYYYIDFHATIDAIKYRIFQLTEKVKALYKPNEEKKDYICRRCKSQWTQLEALKNISPVGEFLCDRCDTVLDYDDASAMDVGGHERQSKLMAQLEPLLKLMQQIDSRVIPKNDFDTAFSLAVPIQRNEAINPLRKTEPVNSLNGGRPAAVKGLTQVTVAPLEVSLTTGSEHAAAERLAAQRKAELAAQNALPVWHTASTVTGETTVVGMREKQRLANIAGTTLSDSLKAEEEEKKETNVLDDELEAYYAQMAREKAMEAQEDASSAEDDDDDEFEDVGIGAPSGVNTPSSSTSGAVNGPKPAFGIGAAQRLKVESDSGSSAPGTTASTPAATSFGADDRGGDSPAKRRKLDELVNGADSGPPAPSRAEVAEKEDSDEDDVEFEDV
jgi:transcription initiation factor TFIIE subunit alpha